MVPARTPALETLDRNAGRLVGSAVRSQDIEIPEPCHADWDAMRPEERGKFCFECRKTVHDLSSMTEDEAKAFLRRSACNDICISFEHDEEGNLVFEAPAPRPAPVVPISRLRRPRKVAAAVASVGVAAALAACAPHGDGPTLRQDETIVFQSRTVIIPHGDASEATPVPTPEPTPVPIPEPTVEEDEPCDGPPPVADDSMRRIKGKIKRTAGKPILRKKGDVARVDPFAL